MVGSAVPTTVWSSATSMVTKEMPSIAKSDSRNGRDLPTRMVGGGVDSHF